MLKSAFAASAAIIILSASASAQEGGAPDFVALGVATAPDHPGSDEYRILPFGAGRVRLGEVVLQVEGPGLSAAFLDTGRVEAGAYARWYGGRDSDIDDPVVRLLPEADGGAVLGGFVRVLAARGLTSDFDRVYLSARAGADVTGEYDGLFWSASAAWTAPLSPTTLFIANLSVSGTPDSYADRLFSVDAVGFAASGLPVHTAEGGIQDIGVTLFLDQQVSENWSVTGVLGASRLQGDYADSPIVTVRGSDTPVFAGIAIGRRF
ncbi:MULTISPECIES: MipA/OmpV family protein [Hyphobacterium]|uniref:MipA/OmpV family protein n=1 Tax=Hyphobacterium vulgare TaxID=1736751 RepID=A0ABV6ZXE1_9PROT